MTSSGGYRVPEMTSNSLYIVRPPSASVITAFSTLFVYYLPNFNLPDIGIIL